jgi:CSLREA domain-containing protein
VKRNRRIAGGLGLAAVAVATALVFASPGIDAAASPAAAGKVFVVTSHGDAADAVPGRGVCKAVGGGCTLRAAVQEGAEDVALGEGPVTIELPAGHIDLGSELDVPRGNITILGAAMSSTVISAGGSDRAFDVASGVNLTLDDLTVTDGASDVEGGAIRAFSASLTLHDVAVTNSVAQGNGGALFAGGSDVSVSDCIFSGDVGLAGGALDTYGGTLSITKSTFTGLLARDVGGAVAVGLASAVEVKNSTFSTNTSEGSGGALYLSGASGTPTYAISKSTFDGNVAFGGNGGAIATDGLVGPGASANLTIANDTFTKNRADQFGGAVSSAITVALSGNTYSANSAPTSPDISTPTQSQ